MMTDMATKSNIEPNRIELIRFVSASGLVLEKVCEYFYYNEKNREAKDVPEMDFPSELCLELLMAADYLDGMLNPSPLFRMLRRTDLWSSLNESMT